MNKSFPFTLEKSELKFFAGRFPPSFKEPEKFSFTKGFEGGEKVIKATGPGLFIGTSALEDSSNNYMVLIRKDNCLKLTTISDYMLFTKEYEAIDAETLDNANNSTIALMKGYKKPAPEIQEEEDTSKARKKVKMSKPDEDEDEEFFKKIDTFSFSINQKIFQSFRNKAN